MNEEHLTGSEGIKKIAALIKDIRIAMMTTAAPDGSFDSRPMATQKTEFDGSIFFLTRQESGKVHEIADNSHVSLLYADEGDGKYITVKGKGSVYRDEAKIHELWSPIYKAWFPGGETDAAIGVLRIDVSEAQYWEASSSRLIRGIKYVAAAATGGKVDLGKTGKVDL